MTTKFPLSFHRGNHQQKQQQQQRNIPQMRR